MGAREAIVLHQNIGFLKRNSPGIPLIRVLLILIRRVVSPVLQIQSDHAITVDVPPARRTV